MEQILQVVELVSGKMSEIARSDLVAGEPLVFGKVTVVPLCQVGVGFGGGGGEGEGDMSAAHQHKGGPKPPFKTGKGTGLGAGGGGKVRPVAVVIFEESGVRVEPIPDRKGFFDKVFDRIPQLMELAEKAKAKAGG